MVLFFKGNSRQIIAVGTQAELSADNISKLEWLFSGAKLSESKTLEGFFVGPRKEMITPWSTNAVEITQNMGIDGIIRVEEFFEVDSEKAEFDPMLQAMYKGLDEAISFMFLSPSY